MRVISQMRAAASGVSTPRAILAAFAISAVALAGCGQRGPLYMPTVPPLPATPGFETGPQGGATKAPTGAPNSASEPVGTIPDTSGTPLSLSPDTELSAPPAATGSPQPASEATPTQ
jgi:predicted small lipoprotein YifL